MTYEDVAPDQDEAMFWDCPQMPYCLSPMAMATTVSNVENEIKDEFEQENNSIAEITR